MIIKKTNKYIAERQADIAKEFRESRGQFQDANYDSKKLKENANTMYKIFLRKYENLEQYIDSLTSMDLVFYFIKVSEENGFSYFPVNKLKDIKIMKWLQEHMTNQEICSIIDFLYKSDQNYINRNYITPNILYSNWINKLYPDMKLWVAGEYQIKNKNKVNSKEWDAEKEGMKPNSVIIGDKL